MQKLNIFYYIVSLFFITACQSEADKRLAYALKLAGENQPELEKVLSHYKQDSLKLKAACFLIENMPGHAGYPPALIQELQPVYKQHVAISKKYNWTRSSEWKKEIDEQWNNNQKTVNLSRYPMEQDLKVIKADWLIKEIDQAFKAWQENAYTKNMPFDDFCRYILPYRFNDKYCIDNSTRKKFYDRHHGLYNTRTNDFSKTTDSLHYIYSAISHSKGTAFSMPIVNIEAYEQIKRGICEDQTQFNSHLMSALGMAVVTDFVPVWGNRTDGHGWNALIIDGKTFPFEPFWDKERWKYNRIYNNETFDLQYGRFRLPKVYRHTFEYYLPGPMTDEKESRENIPALFLNPWMKDVSTEYFKTSDVTIRLTEKKPDDTQYCYLFVYDAKRYDWIPVQWCKIEKETAVFKDMGRNIVYLPGFYQNGQVIPAAPVFILSQDGKYNQLKCNGMNETIKTNTATPLGPNYEKRLNGSRLIGSNEQSLNEEQELLYNFNDTVDVLNNFKLHPKKKYRYIHLIQSNDTVALNEIAFYEKQGNQFVYIPNKNITASIKAAPNFELKEIADRQSGTGYLGFFESKKEKEAGILFDLGEPRLLESVSVIPLPERRLNENADYTLYYWDNEWKKYKTVEVIKNAVTFEQVPAGTLYLIKSSIPMDDSYYNERIFTYKNGMINWW